MWVNEDAILLRNDPIHLNVPLLARCLIVSISTPVIRAFFMAEVARGQPERLGRQTHVHFIYRSHLCFT